METKGQNPVNYLIGKQPSPLFEAYFELCHLKQLYRQGWLHQGVPKELCESVAEHSFSVAVLALWLSQAYYPELDYQKLLQMALLHDLGEIYAGDITPGDGLSESTKHQNEERSIARVLAKLPGGDFLRQLWEEFEQGASAEARFIRQVDRLEMGLQAVVYEVQAHLDMQTFLDSARKAVIDVKLTELLDEAVAVSAFNDSSSPSEV